MILIRDARILNFTPLSVSGPSDILIEGGLVKAVGQGLAARYSKAEIIDSNGFVSPGLVSSHTHVYSALARGLTARVEPSKDFVQQLQHLWWRLDRAIDERITRASALAAASEALRKGVTSLVDHHASPNAIEGSLTAIRESFEALGLRGILCYETTDRNGSDGARRGITENVRFAKEVDSLRKEGKPCLVEAAIGAHAFFTITDPTRERLEAAVVSTGRGLHIHAAEDRFDASDSRYRFGADLAARLDKADLLGPKTLLAHGTWLSPGEIALVNERDSFLIHNARSNMNNAVGYAAWLPFAKNPALGTDGIDQDILAELAAAFFRHREGSGTLWTDDFLGMLDGGNRILDRYFGASFGSIKAGAKADIVLWDYDPPTPLSEKNLGAHFVFGANAISAKTVIVEGRIAVSEGRPLFDAAGIAAAAREEASRLWRRMEDV